MPNFGLLTVASMAALGVALKTYLTSGREDDESKTDSNANAQEPKCPFTHSVASNQSVVPKFPMDYVDESKLPLQPGQTEIRCPMTGKTHRINSHKPISRRSAPIPKRGLKPVHYHSYLCLDQVLSAQKPKSLEVGGELAHDEVLFIITHQTHELWFKQILHDISSVNEIMSQTIVDERDLAKVNERLGRTVQIQRMLVDHLRVLETMTPLSFLEFREFLFPASGFQSMQFRQLEVNLGLRRSQRHVYGSDQYDCALTPEQMTEIRELEKNPSLFDLIDKWLSRLPVLQCPDFDFWKEYQLAVRRMFQVDTDEIEEYYKQGRFSLQVRNSRLADIQSQSEFFDKFFDESYYEKERSENRCRLSYKACQSALMINFYQEEPLFQAPFQLLTLLIELDAQLSAWRGKHATMVHRMLGLKMGTGGSSGFAYLSDTVNHHKVFSELCNLASLMVPRGYLPELPESVSLYTSFLPTTSLSLTSSLNLSKSPSQDIQGDNVFEFVSPKTPKDIPQTFLYSDVASNLIETRGEEIHEEKTM